MVNIFPDPTNDITSQQPESDLLFINIGSNEARPSAETRTMVRKHVMHNTTRRRKAQERTTSQVSMQNVRRLVRREPSNPDQCASKSKTVADDVSVSAREGSLNSHSSVIASSEKVSQFNISSVELEEAYEFDLKSHISQLDLSQEWSEHDMQLDETQLSPKLTAGTVDMELARTQRGSFTIHPPRLDPFRTTAAPFQPTFLDMADLDRCMLFRSPIRHFESTL